MTKPFQQDQYTIEFGFVSYPVRLMLGRPGYWGEWYCPLCDQFANADPKTTDSEARAEVIGHIANHHKSAHGKK
ncbi:hypothetical protein [Anatilimnocola floriformis]|uniref:hypothetical protein n=1 Tax=Anatilimnocola floriformis TaxID=2948575 RepID=UPI0020C3168D|nr:hypothetical protein [Anatilimnocola floriformis]